MAVRPVGQNEDLNEAMRQARGDSVTVDSYATPESHKRVNAALLAARKRGTWETNEYGEITHVEGKPVRKKQA
jgi:hypothetical protein